LHRKNSTIQKALILYNMPTPRFLLRALLCNALNKNLGFYFSVERCKELQICALIATQRVHIQ